MPTTMQRQRDPLCIETSFKSYLSSTMTQEHCNYLMLLHVHMEETYALDLKVLLKEFVEFSNIVQVPI